MRVWMRSFLAVGLAAGLCSSAGAQQGNVAAGGLVLHQNVRRVVLDIVVTDNEGRHARGLLRQDFSLLEDGKPVAARAFEEHNLTDAAGIALAKAPELPPMCGSICHAPRSAALCMS